MGEGIPGCGNAGGTALGLGMDAAPLARAVQVASEEISPEDMKNLNDATTLLFELQRLVGALGLRLGRSLRPLLDF